ncbi:MAG TPA: DUF192 domain-containing protein [Acidimicrobiales bacterium]|jgi:hypothetical protein|nr:DUF192 domain-containing protein [Acidimicrobiales bacterium]
MTWLLRGGDVLAAADVVRSRFPLSQGLQGKDSYEGALVLEQARAVHTFGMRFPVDVAFCDQDLVVVRVARMRPWRVGRPCSRARLVIEGKAGSFERWGLAVGDTVELR